MSEINESCDISVLIFFGFWCSSSNAKSIILFCKKHFTQLIKLINIFNLINILISCFNATWSKTSLTSRSRQISVFSRLFAICASSTKFSDQFKQWFDWQIEEQTHTKRTSHQSTLEQHRRLRTDAKIEIELLCTWRLHREQRCFREVQRFLSNHYLFYLFLMRKTISRDQSLLFWAR